MRRVSLSLSFGEMPPPPDAHDRQQLIVALQAAHARDHELVQTVAQLHQALAEQNSLLRTRTVERDHFKQDGHLWALCLAYLVGQETDDELQLPISDVNEQEGRMLDARVEDGYVRITVKERPLPSIEGGGDGG